LRSENNIPWVLIFLISAGLFIPEINAQKSYDSLRVKTPKHYFNTVFVLDRYAKPSKKLDTLNSTGKRLGSYGIKQYDISFYIPVFTKDYKGSGADSNVISNLHLLLTGNFQSLRPVFSGISPHRLVKRSIGARGIYNSGKKAVWFVDIAPFITRDITYRSDPIFRLASTLVYSYNVNDRFNWRLGVTKSFQWGNRLYLPFIGLRFGRLDKLNLSVQFPRSISLNLPFSPNFVMSVYSRPQGGIYNFSNHDTLYPRPTDATFHFTRYEINTGMRFDVRIGSHFAFFIAAGLSTRNNITFYSERANKNRPRLPYKIYFYSDNPKPTLFGQFGIVLKFGKTRSYYNNRNMYDAIDLNNKAGVNDGNRQIPIPPKKAPKNINLESVRDLIDYNDDF
jgi:hypothetical protein